MSYAPTARHDLRLYESQILKEIGEKYQKTITQIILRWDIDTGTIPIPGSKSKDHIIENADLFDFNLTEDEIDRINTLECNGRVRFDPKKRFSTKQKIKFALLRLRIGRN